MRARLALALVGLSLVATALPSHAAATPVLDGKKTKKITKTVNGGLQDHDQDQANGATGGAACGMPHCYRLDFIYAPAKGVKGNLAFSIKWTNPASDIDLYVANAKKGEVDHCGGFGGAGEALIIPGSRFKVGQKYTLVVDFYRSLNETVTATVEFPTARTQSTTVPDSAEAAFKFNCVLDGNK